MASDYLLEIEGIKGESKDTKHPASIEIMSYSFGASNAGSFAAGTGAGSGKVNVHDISITKVIDKASPILFNYCATGKHIPKIELHVRKAGKPQEEYLTFTFTDTLVDSIQGHGSDPRVATEQLSINFAKVQVDYRRLDSNDRPTGPTVTGVFVAQPDPPGVP